MDFDKGRAAWELYGSSDWQRDSMDATNGFAFTVSLYPAVVLLLGSRWCVRGCIS